MPIDFTCPDCGKEMTARDELAGRRGKCSRCGQAFRVPGGTTDFPAYPPETGPMIVVPETMTLIDEPRPSSWVAVRRFAAMVLVSIADAMHNLAVGIAQLFIVGEWVLTRLALYAMVFGGIGGSAASSGPDPFSQEMHRLYGHLSWMIGVLGLAIVSRMPAKELARPEEFSPRRPSPSTKVP